MSRILVGMSGGIDSAVASWLLKEQGHEVIAVTMSLFKDGLPGDPSKGSCFSPLKKEDIEKSAEICGKLGIRHVVLDISDLYQSVVLRNFRDEYLNGRTPNPCIWCNQKIKFGVMVENARQAGLEFDFFATGHYARIGQENGRYSLLRGVDPVKDQSYFLYRLSQKQLSTTLFPLGNMTKAQVREIDQRLGFHPQTQTESQDFYEGHYSELLGVPSKPGDIVDSEGHVLGRHNGIWNYTIGQRKGLGIAAPMPLYVLELDPSRNQVVVGYEDRTVNMTVRASSINWVSIPELDTEIHAQAKIRSTGAPMPCTVFMDESDHLCARFDNPVKAATCGQSLVVFDDDRILCGGIIDSVD